MENELLRNRSTLRILGMGSIALTIWTAFKPVLVFLAIPGEQLDIGSTTEPLDEEAIVALIILLIAGCVVVSRLWIGLSAISEGTGKPRGKGYMVLAFLFFAFQILLFAGSILTVIHYDYQEESLFETVASLMVELMSLSMMGELAFTSKKVKKLSRMVN